MDEKFINDKNKQNIVDEIYNIIKPCVKENENPLIEDYIPVSALPNMQRDLANLVEKLVRQGVSQPMQGCGHVRTLPEQKPRVETGRLKFGNDWTGLFLRGDDCAKFYCDLITIKEMDELDAITKVRIEYWMKLLNSACESITEWQ